MLRHSLNTRLASGILSPAKEKVKSDVVVSHVAEPIKKVEDIDRVCKHLLETENYRDYLLFVVGINTGLRASDLRMLRFCDLINEDCTFKDTFPVFEIKTRNTRTNKRNRYITVNDAMAEAVTIYLEHVKGISLSDYLFLPMDPKSGTVGTMAAIRKKPIEVEAIERAMKRIGRECGLTNKMSSHTLRKTFCYHQMMMSKNDPRKLMLLQKMLGHASPAQTLSYIGITDEEVHDAYAGLNLGGGSSCYIQQQSFLERDEETGETYRIG